MKSGSLARRARLKKVSLGGARRNRELEKTKRIVRARSGGRCEVLPFPWDSYRCHRRAEDFHHVVKRSQGGRHDPANVIHLCRCCHHWTDHAYSARLGRLVIVPREAGRFSCRLIFAKDKAEGLRVVAAWKATLKAPPA